MKYDKTQILKMLDKCADGARPLIYQFNELKGSLEMRVDPDTENAICSMGGNLLTHKYKMFFSIGLAVFNHITHGFTMPFVVAHELGHYQNEDKEIEAQISGDIEAQRENEFIADQLAVRQLQKSGYKFITLRACVYLIGAIIYAIGFIDGIKYLCSNHPESEHPSPVTRIWRIAKRK